MLVSLSMSASEHEGKEGRRSTRRRRHIKNKNPTQDKGESKSMSLASSGLAGGSLGALLGRLGGLLGGPEAILGHLGAILGCLGGIFGHLGGFGGLPGPSWKPSWASWTPWRAPGTCLGADRASGRGGDARGGARAGGEGVP